MSIEEDFDYPAAVAAALAAAAATPDAPEVAALPYWQESYEAPNCWEMVSAFRTSQCAFGCRSGGGCARQCGKAARSQASGPQFCAGYHQPSLRRRPLFKAGDSRMLYWDVPCTRISSFSTNSMTGGAPSGEGSLHCPDGDDCIFAHNQEEISYHAAKYKTKPCNGTASCRGEATCCFAHGPAELRPWAPERYSYFFLLVRPNRVLSSNSLLSGGPSPAKTFDLRSSPKEWCMGDPSTACLASYPSISCAANFGAPRQKQRFCASYPGVERCKRSPCAFAHSREEITGQLLTEQEERQEPIAMTEQFFMHRFKTFWCPIGVQHDWQTCVYAHNYQDARRCPSIGYGPKPCPHWSKKDTTAEYSQRCPLGLRCPYSHGAKEQLYHPQYFRSVVCRDLSSHRKQAGRCPRETLCAFFHSKTQSRRLASNGKIDYEQPLLQDRLPADWIQDFINPPFFSEKGDPIGDETPWMVPGVVMPRLQPFYYGIPILKDLGPREDSPETQSTTGGSGSDSQRQSSSSSSDGTDGVILANGAIVANASALQVKSRGKNGANNRGRHADSSSGAAGAKVASDGHHLLVGNGGAVGNNNNWANNNSWATAPLIDERQLVGGVALAPWVEVSREPAVHGQRGEYFSAQPMGGAMILWPGGQVPVPYGPFGVPYGGVPYGAYCDQSLVAFPGHFNGFSRAWWNPAAPAN